MTVYSLFQLRYVRGLVVCMINSTLNYLMYITVSSASLIQNSWLKCFIKICHLNSLKTKRRPLYLKTQFVAQ